MEVSFLTHWKVGSQPSLFLHRAYVIPFLLCGGEGGKTIYNYAQKHSSMVQSEVKQFYSSKKLLGELVRVLAIATDPAHLLGYTAMSINTARAIMIGLLELQVPTPELVTATIQALMLRTIECWHEKQTITPEEAQELQRMVMDVYRTEPIAQYDQDLYRDIMICEDLHNNWICANKTYIADKSAWSESNAILVDINKILMEIIIRHDLMQVPFGDTFNLDTAETGTSQLHQLLSQLSTAQPTGSGN